MPQKDYEAISHAKRLQRGGNIPREWTFDPKIHQGIDLLDVPITCGLLTDAEIDITSKFDATSLLKGLKAGIWSVEQVTTAFCKRAAIAQQLVSLHHLFMVTVACLADQVYSNFPIGKLSDRNILQRSH